ncbi:hypothetical protein [Mariniflexile sp.]|uniref:hypothetical protein n=1 Tax=Mariniflexile sp. TaxID=1979402 RepID=UPI00356686C5
MEYRDLEKVRLIIEAATGLEIAYAYDDLVFPDYTAFIMQFDDSKSTHFFCHFHEDCNEKETLFKELSNACKQQKCTLTLKGDFKLAQKNEAVELQFI